MNQTGYGVRLRRRRVSKAALIGVDLFCGAGGMTLGAKRAGIDVAFAVESDPNQIERSSIKIATGTMSAID
jgi:DNA (cytosine-5)-methyltransferase 1